MVSIYDTTGSVVIRTNRGIPSLSLHCRLQIGVRITVVGYGKPSRDTPLLQVNRDGVTHQWCT